jgi:hypothetical protein
MTFEAEIVKEFNKWELCLSRNGNTKAAQSD